MYSYNYDYAEPECQVDYLDYEKKIDQLNCAEYWVRCIVDIAYGKPKFPNETFDDYLEELCAVFDLKLPENKQLTL